MTVKQLKQKLEGLPDDMDVMIYQTNDEEYGFSMADNASVQKVTFMDKDMPSDEHAKVDCLVISDDI